MRMLGIDPGYDRAGFSCIDHTHGVDLYVYSECFVTSKSLPFEKRLSLVGEHLHILIDRFHPTHIALEKVYFSANKKTALSIAEVRGALRHISEERRLPLIEVTPAEVKQSITGYGNSSKKNVATMVAHILAIPEKKRLDDEYDAIAIALTAIAIHNSQM
ncbi:MAG: crossover junction endodeoxyribonuclease RuvC [Alphaproteobacteria bacterium]|nr:crossover junction endodeoxyribonuclease RuvC [Alphaproteobacteria bacterium]